MRNGSHYVTHADSGYKDGEHKAWLIVDVESRQDARRILPTPFRSQAKFIELNRFTVEELDDILRHHK